MRRSCSVPLPATMVSLNEERPAGSFSDLTCYSPFPCAAARVMPYERCSCIIGNVLCVRWSPDSHYLASGSDDFIVIVWEKDEYVTRQAS